MKRASAHDKVSGKGLTTKERGSEQSRCNKHSRKHPIAHKTSTSRHTITKPTITTTITPNKLTCEMKCTTCNHHINNACHCHVKQQTTRNRNKSSCGKRMHARTTRNLANNNGQTENKQEKRKNDWSMKQTNKQPMIASKQTHARRWQTKQKHKYWVLSIFPFFSLLAQHSTHAQRQQQHRNANANASAGHCVHGKGESEQWMRMKEMTNANQCQAAPKISGWQCFLLGRKHNPQVETSLFAGGCARDNVWRVCSVCVLCV